MAEVSEEPIDNNQSEKHRQLLTDMRKRYKDSLDADEEQRRDAMEDMKFATLPGYQWDENQKKERGKRPCYEFNKIRVTGKRIINNMRDNRPAGKVRGTEDNDKDTAEIYEGLIRNIWNRGGDAAIDYAAEYQVFGGMGAWRITTDYIADDVFEQDIGVDTLVNPFCLFSDPAAKDALKRTARYWILTEKIPNEVYEAEYPKADIIDFPSHEFDDDEEWQDDEETRIAEYWYKEPVEKELWQLQDGKVIDSASDEARAIPEEAIVKRRMVETFDIMMCIASGNAILKGPVKWAGSQFPFVPVYGEYYIIDGKTHWNGITRFAKDAQRSYNVSRTAVTETIAMAPQAKYWATVDQAEGHTTSWKTAHQKNYPFLLYSPDPLAPGPPQRMGGADIPVALIQESQLAAEEINMVTGIYQQDVGAPNQAKSGKQELARMAAGNIATFNYQDNMAQAIERTWELLIDLIPQVYSTERELRVLGADGAEDYVRINTIVNGPEGVPIKVHDMAQGKYDVTITVGPSFTTKRQEAAETYQALLQSSPDMFPIVGDLIFKSMDLPYSDEIAERLAAMLPPQIQALQNKDAQMPPEIMQMMQQAEQAQMMVQEQMAQVQQAAQEVEQEAQNAAKETGKAEKAKSEVNMAISDLEKQEAEFEATVAKEIARITKMSSDFALKVAADGGESQETEQNNQQNLEFIEAIRELAAQFNQQAMDTLAMIENQKQNPKVTRIVQKRVNGELVAVPEYAE